MFENPEQPEDKDEKGPEKAREVKIPPGHKKVSSEELEDDQVIKPKDPRLHGAAAA